MKNNTTNIAAVPVSLRTLEDEINYGEKKQQGQRVPLHHEPTLRSWKLWRVIDNRFPYSGAFQTHHLLIPKRPVATNELNHEEKTELDEILQEVSGSYDCYLVNFPSKQSVTNHYHVHLLKYKASREELGI